MHLPNPLMVGNIHTSLQQNNICIWLRPWKQKMWISKLFATIPLPLFTQSPGDIWSYRVQWLYTNLLWPCFLVISGSDSPEYFKGLLLAWNSSRPWVQKWVELLIIKSFHILNNLLEGNSASLASWLGLTQQTWHILSDKFCSHTAAIYQARVERGLLTN